MAREPWLLTMLGCGDGDTEHAIGGNTGPLDEPVLVLQIPGTAPNGDLTFGYAMAATRLSDGVVVIGDNLGPAVQYVNADGDLVATAGREGGGPGARP